MKVAQREGFEPPRELSHRLSRPALYRAKRPLPLKKTKPKLTTRAKFNKILKEPYLRPRAIGDRATFPPLSM